MKDHHPTICKYLDCGIRENGFDFSISIDILFNYPQNASMGKIDFSISSIIKAIKNILRPFRPRNLYFAWQKYRYPDIFTEHLSDGYDITTMDVVRRFNYSISAVKWLADRAELTLRITYTLGPDSIVFDAGGYHGTWAKSIKDKYGPYIHIFEPVPQFCRVLEEKFQKDDKVFIHQYGLSSKDMSARISNTGMGSSLHIKDETGEFVKIRDIKLVLEELGINEIDLIKINIEGEEFPLLQRMIDTGLIRYFKNIQIQFHDFYPNAYVLRKKLQRSLSLTHCVMWDYPFIHESWERKPLRQLDT